MMKQFLKATFVFGLCVRLVLLTSLASAGGPMHDLQKAALASIAQTQEDIEELIDKLEALDPDVEDYHYELNDDDDDCRYTIGGPSTLPDRCLATKYNKFDIRSDKGDSQRQGYFDYQLGGQESSNPFGSSASSKTNPFAKINDAEPERIYTTEECCEALEDYNNWVASCSRSEQGIVRMNRCEINFNGQTILDEASVDVEDKCGYSPEVLNRHRGTKRVCEG